MIIALLLTASMPSVIDVENAFARDALRLGQWTAFRKYADPDAVMFTPQAAWARDFLKGRKNPPRSVRWWPAHSFVSCDGRTAVNSGPWLGADGKTHGYFTRVWQRTGGQWRWVYDGGDKLDDLLPTPTRPQYHRSSCGGKAPGAPINPPPALNAKQARTTPVDNGRGQSADGTLGWDWKVEQTGARQFRMFQWNGARYAQIMFNDVPADK